MGIIQTLRGRQITNTDIDLIRRLVRQHFHRGRKYISCELCHTWKWYQSSGHTKDRAARDILLALEKQNLIQLPKGKHSGNNHRQKYNDVSDLFHTSRNGSLGGHPQVTLKLLRFPSEYALWRSLVHHYHYQGHKVIVGQSLRYIAYIQDEPIACLGWGSAAWSIKPRDSWIGWDKATKDKNLYKIVNNIRFLILPWIKIKYLASHLLSLSVKRIPLDWQKQFGSPVYLLETFVEEARFKGTCYKAANWKYLGNTKGSSKRGSTHQYHGNIKMIYVYPITHAFKEGLTS